MPEVLNSGGFEAEEAFVTNSVLELMPLTWFDGKTIGTGVAGQLTREVSRCFWITCQHSHRTEVGIF